MLADIPRPRRSPFPAHARGIHLAALVVLRPVFVQNSINLIFLPPFEVREDAFHSLRVRSVSICTFVPVKQAN